VNSASQGPYGDAINYELIPYIEETFQGLGEGWARFTYGGSTGGWEAMATQLFYPEHFQRGVHRVPRPHRFPRLPHHEYL
jgi:Enterochelin esterase and related enzymes